jgi:hypothetical protein
MVAKKIGKTVDTLTPEELTAIQKAAKYSVWYVSEQEETDDYDKDEVAMQLVKKSKKTLKTSWAEAPEMFILQKVRRMIGGMGAGQWWRFGLVDWVKAICNACDVVLGKANDREIKTLITWELRSHYIQQDDRKLYKSASYVIEKTGDKPASFTSKEIDDWIRKHDNDFRRVLFASQEQEELPSMERRDMILALAEYMSESWIDTGDDGDLDDIYYAVADILDETGDYPASTSWEDCKPWCQKHYKEVEARIY